MKPLRLKYVAPKTAYSLPSFSTKFTEDIDRCEAYRDGQIVELLPVEERTPKEHRWFFAVCRKAFDNLPEHIDEYKSAEHLRKSALIEAGWCEQRSFDENSLNVICAMTNWFGEYLEIRRGSEGLIYAYRPKSMKMKKNGGDMDAQTFREVTDRAVTWLSQLLGCDVTELLDEVPNVPEWVSNPTETVDR